MSQQAEPEVQGVPVTAGNWQGPPVNRWAFWHLGEILPTYRVSRGSGPARDLPPSPAAEGTAAEDGTAEDSIQHCPGSRPVQQAAAPDLPGAEYVLVIPGDKAQPRQLIIRQPGTAKHPSQQLFPRNTQRARSTRPNCPDARRHRRPQVTPERHPQPQVNRMPKRRPRRPLHIERLHGMRQPPQPRQVVPRHPPAVTEVRREKPRDWRRWVPQLPSQWQPS